jgi:hypothetical protein
MRFSRLLTSHLHHETNRTFTDLVGVLPGSGHDSILSKDRVSTEPGAVQVKASFWTISKLIESPDLTMRLPEPNLTTIPAISPTSFRRFVASTIRR